MDENDDPTARVAEVSTTVRPSNNPSRRGPATLSGAMFRVAGSPSDAPTYPSVGDQRPTREIHRTSWAVSADSMRSAVSSSSDNRERAA